jgi:hypothetical protein
MESSVAGPSAPGAQGLSRALCVLVLLLMTLAVVYAGSIAIRYFGRIGV